MNTLEAVEAADTLRASYSKYKCSQITLIFLTITIITISLFIFTYVLSIFAKMIGGHEILVIICGYCFMFIIIDILYTFCYKYNNDNTTSPENT